ncbi:uroporphyrinogen decarboxylase family protein [Kiritimatiella glycovorans]|uniref:Putative methyltransferase n=1 Tax=Kiritimatiella glycovorans TaxID=1307763 RepID=A0A0G3EGK2_9BACT|nr:uroporphyrinogen decarboxylase family protein [Kiritimatiella glycovorans]AKJ65473.1 putative methyltransferase [Kiritimatiella glycovorans]
MKGKDVLLRALGRETTERPAWVPFVGVHGGNLIGERADDYLKSSDSIVKGIRRANELYRPDGIPVAFDLQIEAEVLGCDLHWDSNVPPSVTTHPLEGGTALEDLPDLSEDGGRFPVVLAALDRLREEIGDETALYGLVCGPFTLALHLAGNEIFIDMYDDEAKVRKLVERCADYAIQSAGFYLDHGADVIAVVDPMTSQISAEHFTGFVTPAMNRVFDYIRGRGSYSSIFVCGDVSRNLDVMCGTEADHISVDEQIDMTRLRELAEKNGKAFGGNIRLTSVLLLGDEDDAKLETLNIMDRSGCTGFVLSPGCDLPYHTPPANLQAVAEMVHDEYAREVARKVLAARGEKEEETYDDIELPDYDAQKAVTLDVITLDSTSCAPCQYMMDAVRRAADDAFVKTYVNEHKIMVRDGIGMMARLGVKNLPTICIDGEIAFSSIIPDHNTLVEAIENKAVDKNYVSKNGGDPNS